MLDQFQKPTGSGIMGALDKLQPGKASSVGITSSQYTSYKDTVAKALERARSAQPYTNSPMAQGIQGPMQGGQSIYEMKVPAPKPPKF